MGTQFEGSSPQSSPNTSISQRLRVTFLKLHSYMEIRRHSHPFLELIEKSQFNFHKIGHSSRSSSIQRSKKKKRKKEKKKKRKKKRKKEKKKKKKKKKKKRKKEKN